VHTNATHPGVQKNRNTSDNRINKRFPGFSKNGIINIDNNWIENAVRPFAVERKNWLFSDRPVGAAASATIYSLIETGKINNLEPYHYLCYLFERLPNPDKPKPKRA
jgi:hypothetical protein